MGKLITQTWQWRFDQPTGKVWPALADTVRFNEAAGYPLHQSSAVTQADGSVRFFSRLKMGYFNLAWEDIPANWVENHWFRHQRVFSKGPFTTLNAHLALHDTPEGCIADYSLEVEPTGVLGRLVLTGGFFARVRRSFQSLAEQAAGFARGETPQPFEFALPELAPGGRERALRLVEELSQEFYAHGLAEKLGNWILTHPDSDVWSIRPLKLARLWQVPERHAIELCLLAASKGLLSLRWDLICPRCRGGSGSSSSMDELPSGTHCDSCNIDYQRNFTRNVELAFFPSRTIRPLGEGNYCLFAPMTTPHIKLQITLPAGVSRREAVELAPGHYRFRTLEPGPEQTLEWEGEKPFPTLAIKSSGAVEVGGQAGTGGNIMLINQALRSHTFVLEERTWMRDILTAHRAATMQCFRELYSDQILRPGDMVEIDSVVLMFTDIRGSTSLYDRVGDADAYSLVREHFALLSRVIRENNGTIVKTIGDAIMAAFINPLHALDSAVQIQAAFHHFNREVRGSRERVVLKLGMHMGPCISLTLNGVLDYYGRAANLCARLEGHSKGGDIVMSEQLARDPSVQRRLEEFHLESELASLRGFSSEIAFYRVSPAQIDQLAERLQAPSQGASD